MAPTPTSSRGIRDLLLPSIHNLCAVHNIDMDIFYEAQSDCLSIKSMSKDRLSRHEGVLLTRKEIEDNVWHGLVRDRMIAAIDAIKPEMISDQFVSEYEEIMAAQDLMEK